jgi:hypothetical protein
MCIEERLSIRQQGCIDHAYTDYASIIKLIEKDVRPRNSFAARSRVNSLISFQISPPRTARPTLPRLKFNLVETRSLCTAEHL